MTEAYTSLEKTVQYYGKVENGRVVEYGAQIPFNFQLMGSSMSSTAFDFKKSIIKFIDNLPKGGKIHANWVVS